MRRVASTLIALLLSAFGVAVTAAPAHALNACNAFTHTQNYGGYWISVPSIGNESGNFECELWEGLTNNNGVRALQNNLNECYMRPNQKTLLSVDGNFGPRTRDALKYAQTLHSISVDGRYGPQTRDNIYWVQDGATGSYTCSWRYRW